MFGKDVEKGNTQALLLGMQSGIATVESSMELPQQLKKWDCLMTQRFHFWEFIQNNLKH